VNSVSTPVSRFPVGLPRGSGLAILRAIGRGRRTVSEIIDLTGLSQPNVSNHLARFRERGWVQAERRGRLVAYRIDDPALAAYVGQIERIGRSLTGAERERLLEKARSTYFQGARLGDSQLAERVIDETLDAGVSWQDVCLEVFAPALRSVGELWERGELSVAAEHAATALTQRIMSRIAPRDLPADRTPLGSVVVACVAGEQHSLGARMVADFFEASGWRVRLLGADLPTEDLLDFVCASRPDIVALSVTGDGAEDTLRAAVWELCRLRRDTGRPLLIGGGQWFDRHPEHGLPLDLCGGDLPSVVVAAGRLLVGEK